jgi:hypothetical protein
MLQFEHELLYLLFSTLKMKGKLMRHDICDDPNMMASFSRFVLLLPTILIYLALVSPKAYGQFQLPKKEILASHQIKRIQVLKVPLRMVDVQGDSLENQKAMITEFKTAQPFTFYLNEMGSIDSVLKRPNKNGYYQKIVYTYDSLDRMVGTERYNSDQLLEGKAHITQMEDGGWHFESWESNQMKEEAWATRDSIVYKRLYYWEHHPEKSYQCNTFDILNHVKTTSIWQRNRLIKEEKHQWLVEDSVPTTFVYNIFEHEDPKKKPKGSTHRFEIDSLGWAVNKQNGTIFDPFRMYNFYERFERSRIKGLSSGFEAMFCLDELTTDQEVQELWSFDGTSVIYRYEFYYD